MSKIFFTSDTHFGHENIIKYSNRPFKNANEMDEHIIRVWNQRVTEDDDVYHLGDFGFSKEDRLLSILQRLRGKIHFIWGNHDKVVMRSNELKKMFIWCRDYYELKVNDPDAEQGTQMLCLFHFPMVSWNKMHRGSWHLHGHCHHNLKYPFSGRILDVGVDGNPSCLGTHTGALWNFNYGPVSYDEVKTYMKSVKQIDLLDHHGTR